MTDMTHPYQDLKEAAERAAHHVDGPPDNYKAWVRVYDGKIERECLDTYGLYTTRAAARANWWGEPGEFIRVEIRPVKKVKK